MPPIRIKFVVSFSSQDSRHTVEDLVRGKGSWLSHADDRSGRLQADLQLEHATGITYIDLGNSGSVMVSVEVGRSSWPASKPLVTLLPTVAIMTPAEWRSGKNTTAVRMFKQEDLNSEAVGERWDRVRLICTQPFRKDAQFGLSMFRLHTNTTEITSEADLPDQQRPNLPHQNSKKEELLARMNLPQLKKKTMSQSIGWLESATLTKGEELSSTGPLNPITSPMSRAARLVVMAAKPTSKSEADSQKAALECEALDFLISLNLSMDDINSLKVSGVRQRFEQMRQKLLTQEEKIIFKDIALDYAKQRLNGLERQQEKSAATKLRESIKPHNNQDKLKERGKENRSSFINNVQKNSKQSMFSNSQTDQAAKVKQTTASSSRCVSSNSPQIKASQGGTQGKFTFKHIKNSNSSLEKKAKSPHIISSERLKLRMEDDLLTESPSGSSRNNIALSDSKVTTPSKRPRIRSKKKVSPKILKTQTDLNGWITPKGKKKSEHQPFTYTTINSLQMAAEVSDFEKEIEDDSESEREAPSKNSSSSGGGFMDDVTPWLNADPRKEKQTFEQSPSSSAGGRGYCLGSAPADKHGVSNTRKRFLEDSSETINSSSPRSSKQSTMVECPLCSDLFPSHEVEDHAATCGTVISSDSDETDVEIETTHRMKNTTLGDMEECPVCGDFISSEELATHAADCADRAFS